MIYSAKELSKAWSVVVETYRETIEQNNPAVTMQAIVEKIGIDKTKQTFAAIAAIKKHDGRIYGKNREFCTQIEITPEVNDLNYAIHTFSHLDEIHTAHISNLITELRKIA